MAFLDHDDVNDDDIDDDDDDDDDDEEEEDDDDDDDNNDMFRLYDNKNTEIVHDVMITIIIIIIKSMTIQ